MNNPPRQGRIQHLLDGLDIRPGEARTVALSMAGAFVLMLSSLTVIGTLLSDILLAWLDPRIRYA